MVPCGGEPRMTKRGYEATIPVSPEVGLELEGLRKRHPGLGEGFLFPAPNAPDRPLSVQVAAQWLHRAEKLAGLDRIARGGWHALRRRWATARKDMSVKDVMQAGGWKDAGTLLRCYQVADVETMEQVVLQPSRLLKNAASETPSTSWWGSLTPSSLLIVLLRAD